VGYGALVSNVVQLGLATALVVFFVWMDELRKRQIALAVSATETFIRETLVAVIEKNTEVMARNNELMAHVSHTLESCGGSCEASARWRAAMVKAARDGGGGP
jgi:hypothetical protein